MRIVLASNWWPPRVGGIESQVADLAGALVSRGHIVRVLTATKDPVPVPGAVVDTIEWPVVSDVTLPDLRRVSAMAKYLEQAAPDVVHANGMFLSLPIGAILAASRLGIPSVSTVHSLLRPWPVLLAGCAVFRAFSHRASVLTAVSAATARDVRRASGREAIQIPNGLHLARWRVPRHKREPDAVRIVSVTRLVPKKSPIDLIRGLYEARTRRNDVTLTIAGDGPERTRLEREARTLGVGDYVRFLGPCSRDGVRRLLADASLLAHPGRLEAFGLALLEARAAGVPVVAIASGGVPEIVTDLVHGLLASSARGLPRAIAELAANDDLRRRCAEQAPSGLEAFDWSQVVGRHEAVYARAIEGLDRSPHGRHRDGMARHDGEGRRRDAAPPSSVISRESPVVGLHERAGLTTRE